jgi:hypothetical protein
LFQFAHHVLVIDWLNTHAQGLKQRWTSFKKTLQTTFVYETQHSNALILIRLPSACIPLVLLVFFPHSPL